MKRIVIGLAGRQIVSIDLDVLLYTRLLIQANSGGGKSYLLRRLAEQLFGKVPVVIIDPEGEFATLREKFGFVLVGKGGETPADPRSAAMVAHKLLELRASAVCDLYDLKPQQRHHWVKNFLEGLMEAPKNLWHPMVIMVDESHLFCPEKGESEAYGAMQDLVTRGRKRGLCPVLATQRLAKLSKSVSAEMLNRLVGQTFEDVDVERAAALLSVPSSEQKDFIKQMRVLERGHFWAFGRAISKERVLVKVGHVQTTHPQPGVAIYASPPPAPEKVKAMLPKLADLPKAAEEQARTVGELRQEIRSLKAQLVARPQKVVETVETKVDRVEVPILKDAHLKALVKVANELGEASLKNFLAVDTLKKIIDPWLPKKAAPEAPKMQPPKYVKMAPMPPLRRPMTLVNENPIDPDHKITPAQTRILQALADFKMIGRDSISRTWVAARAGASHRSSAFANNLGFLRGKSLIAYVGSGVGVGGVIQITEAGMAYVEIKAAPMTQSDMIDSCMKLLTPAQARILKAVYELHPEGLSRQDLAVVAGASAASSAFANNLGALRSAGMIEYADGGVKCADWIFLNHDAITELRR